MPRALQSWVRTLHPQVGAQDGWRRLGLLSKQSRLIDSCFFYFCWQGLGDPLSLGPKASPPRPGFQ